MTRKLIAVVVFCAALTASPSLAAAGNGNGGHNNGGKAAEKKRVTKRLKPRALATRECTQQLHQMGAHVFKETYGSFQGCVDEIIDEAAVAVAQAIEECRRADRRYGRCINRRAMAILQELLATPPPPNPDPDPPPPNPDPDPPPPPTELSCPIDLGSTEAGLADLTFPDLTGETLSPELAAQVQNVQALVAELQELLALLSGQTGTIGQMLLDQLSFVEQQLRSVLPGLEASLNAELCPAG